MFPDELFLCAHFSAANVALVLWLPCACIAKSVLRFYVLRKRHKEHSPSKACFTNAIGSSSDLEPM